MGMSELWTPDRTAELFAFLLDVVVLKGGLVVCVAVLACLLARRASASVRHGIWASLFVVLLVLPWAPRRPVVPPDPAAPYAGASSARVAATPAEATAAGGARGGSVLRSSGVGSGEAVVGPKGRRPSRYAGADAAPVMIEYAPFQTWAVWLWLTGAVLGLARLLAGACSGWRLKRRAVDAPDWILDRARAMAGELGLSRLPEVRMSAAVDGPGTLGTVRPMILIPDDVGSWRAGAVDAALAHELSHLRRRDYLVHVLAGLVRALYWINPAVRYAERRLDRERERACDDGVVHRCIDPVHYAEVLLGFALRSRAATPVLPLAARSSLGERVKSLLDPGQARSPLGRGGRLTITVAALAVIAGTGGVELFGVAPPEAQHPVEELTSQGPAARQRGAWALGEAEDPRHVPALVETLADSEPVVRAVAAWALGEIKDPSAIPALVHLLSDSDPLVREMAVLALGEIEDGAALQALEGLGDQEVPADARRWALDQIRHGAGGPEVFVGDLSGVRADRADSGVYLDALEGGGPRERARAAEALGRMGSVEAVDALLRALSDPEPLVRARVIWALDEINPTRDGRPPRR